MQWVAVGFTVVRVLLAVGLYGFAALFMGLALVPAVWLCYAVWQASAHQTLLWRVVWVCLTAGASYYGEQ